MVDWKVVERLFASFPNSFINGSGEFIAHSTANEYFILRNCETELDVKCKVIEWLSRGAYKTEPFRSRKKNREFNEFMLNGLNRFLGTEFTSENMEEIYTYLGNSVNHDKTVEFIKCDYDMGILVQDKE